MRGEKPVARSIKRATSGASSSQVDFHSPLDSRLRRLCALMIVSALSACVMALPSLVYMPADVPTTIDKCAMRYSARLFEQDGVALDLLIDSATGPFRGRLQISIPQGQTATFLDNRVTLANPSRSSSFQFESWSPWCQMPYRISGPRQPFCEFITSILDLEGLVVTVPPLEINSSRYDVRPIRFSPQVVQRVCWLSA